MKQSQWKTPRRLLALTLLTAWASGAGAAPPPTTAPAVLAPLKATVGRHYAFKGTVLSFRAEQPITDEQWTAIEALGIRLIVTGGKGIDDAAVGRLAKLDPEGLALDGSSLTDDGCRYLAEMKSLRWLSVGHTTFGKNGFTGAGFSQLKNLPKLERLSFGGTSAGDTAMEAIGELSQLKELSTGHTHFTSASNHCLLKLNHLTSLSLGNSLPAWNGKPRQLSLTDETLGVIAQIPSLENLSFSQARFTLAALERLKALPALKTLKLSSIEIDPADIEKLRAQMPGVKIDFKPLSDEERKKLEDFLTHT